MDRRIKIGITMGDYNGIGPEVIIKTLSDNRILELATPVVYGSSKVFSFYKKTLEQTPFSFQIVKSASNAEQGKISMVNVSRVEDLQITPGVSTKEAGMAAFDALETAVSDLKSGIIDAMVTAPINKDNIQSDQFQFPGHTEYLQQSFGAESSLMFMIAQGLRIGFLTGHMPIGNVPSCISEGAIEEKIKLIAESLKQDFAIPSPRIAVLSLNPHAGDNGLLGTEEQNVIIPAIRSLKEKGMMVLGPYPPDGFFTSELSGKFDAVLAMYHDQGMIPFKSLSDHQGVNYTAGLPAVRTSPAHGTAYDIADKAKADAQSFRAAFYAAIDICRTREEYFDLTEDSLK